MLCSSCLLTILDRLLCGDQIEDDSTNKAKRFHLLFGIVTITPFIHIQISFIDTMRWVCCIKHFNIIPIGLFSLH